MRIVITGASGNVGTAVLRRLAGAGHHLVGVCRRPPEGGAPYTAADWAAVDLSAPAAGAALRTVLRGADAVVHLAWAFQPARDADYLLRLGIEGTRAVLEAAQAEHVPHLVHMSSVGAYSPGPDAGRVAEDWSTGGITSLPYSVGKVAAERLLDEHERRSRNGVRIARLRPGLIVQHDAGSALLRYGLPAYLPAALLRHVPVLPLDRGLAVPLVHTDDVASAVALVLERQATGPFNLAAEPTVTRDVIADVLGARPVHVPKAALRAAVSLSYRARLQSLDPGWVDLAFAVPLLDTGRARRELGWSPEVDSRSALADVLAGMAGSAFTTSPALRRRTVAAELSAVARNEPIGTRHRS